MTPRLSSVALALVYLAAGFAAGAWWSSGRQPPDDSVAAASRSAAAPAANAAAVPVDVRVPQAQPPAGPEAAPPVEQTMSALAATAAPDVDSVTQVAIQIAAGADAEGITVPAGHGGQVGQLEMQPSADSALPAAPGAALPSDPGVAQRTVQPGDGS